MSVKYVGFWARVLASMVDSLLLALVLVPIALLLFWDQLMADNGLLEGPANIIFNYLLPVLIVLAFWIYRSATPGKMLIKAVIVDADTLQKPELWQWVIRYLGYYVSGLLLMLGFLWVGWDPRKQGFHDKMARTVVIYRDPTPETPDLPEGI